MLEQMIQEFKERITIRNKKLEDKCQELQLKAIDVKHQIEEEMEKLIAAELSENKKEQVVFNTNIKTLRIDLSDIQDRIEAFSNAKTDTVYTQKDIQSLKKAALKFRENRLCEYKNKDKKCRDIETQIEALKKELDELKRPMPYLLRDTECVMLSPIVQYIDIRAEKLSSPDKRDFASIWLDDRDTEYLFKVYQ